MSSYYPTELLNVGADETAAFMQQYAVRRSEALFGEQPQAEAATPSIVSEELEKPEPPCAKTAAPAELVSALPEKNVQQAQPRPEKVSKEIRKPVIDQGPRKSMKQPLSNWLPEVSFFDPESDELDSFHPGSFDEPTVRSSSYNPGLERLRAG